MMQLDEVESDTIDNVIGTNLTGLIHMTHLVLPVLRSREEAAILNISSQSGIQAQDGQSVYTATKY
jgi:NADP-dependent 3-hydroxy acid dehydrogenase YdfG